MRGPPFCGLTFPFTFLRSHNLLWEQTPDRPVKRSSVPPLELGPPAVYPATWAPEAQPNYVTREEYQRLDRLLACTQAHLLSVERRFRRSLRSILDWNDDLLLVANRNMDSNTLRANLDRQAEI